jgi:hypothetical protein
MEKVTSRDGTPVAYYHGGVGSPLILVHGTGVLYRDYQGMDIMKHQC